MAEVRYGRRMPVEVFDSRTAQVGDMTVRRALPRRRPRRTVGAWCFADHMGPATIDEQHPADIGPHPHTGLQTVTWLVAGELLHRDSLGSEQRIRAGECNLMTAGHGVAHAEEMTDGYRGPLHGIQLWVAQPEATRHGDAAFEHLVELPAVDLDHAIATVIVGDFAGAHSPARRDTDHAGVQLALRPGRSTAPLRPAYEHALIVLDGAAEIDGTVVTPGHLAYLGPGRDELVVSARDETQAMLLGGVPFGEEIQMFWNYVVRSDDEVDAAVASWNEDDGRFGTVKSPLARIPSPVRRP
jgi:redox-sensitive bicupin YhaK (pirin superfamily)